MSMAAKYSLVQLRSRCTALMIGLILSSIPPGACSCSCFQKVSPSNHLHEQKHSLRSVPLTWSEIMSTGMSLDPGHDPNAWGLGLDAQAAVRQDPHAAARLAPQQLHSASGQLFAPAGQLRTASGQSLLADAQLVSSMRHDLDRQYARGYPPAALEGHPTSRNARVSVLAWRVVRASVLSPPKTTPRL